MSFLRRNNANDKQQAVPAPEQPAAPPAQSSGGGGGGIRQWLVDSYNGLYRILLKPNMPTWQSVVLLIIGIVIGVAWGYTTVEFTGANPSRLNDAAQDQWILMVAGSYERGFYGDQAAAELLNRVNDPAGTIERLLQTSTSQSDISALEAIRPIAQSVEGTPPPEEPFNGLLDWVIIVVLAAVIFPILVLLWRMLIYPNLVQPLVDRVHEVTDADYREERQKERAALQAMQQQRAAQVAMRAEGVVDEELGTPVMQSLSIFDRTRHYDDSMEIELPLDQGGDFLGQCGAMVAEAVGSDPVAIEVWLFDMRSQQNLKKVFVAPPAANDPNVLNQLKSDVEIGEDDILIGSPDAVMVLNSDNLRLQAKMTQVQMGNDGRYDNFQIQLRAWQKTGMPAQTPAPAGAAAGSGFSPPPPQPQQPASAPAGGRPISDYEDIQFDPPPTPPAQSQSQQPPTQRQNMPSVGSLMGQPPPPPSGQQQQSEENLPPPAPGFNPYGDDDEDDDDPFGATGDFTPIGRP